MKTIVLTGMMGSGKTTIAQLLSKELNIKYIDIDQFIEEKEKTTISKIFESQGENYFRELERNTIQEVFEPANLIISLGGGALENPQTREFLLNNSMVIYLKTSPEIIYKRIKNNNERPLLNNNMNIEKIAEIISKREKNYQTAHKTIVTDNKIPVQIIKEITGVL